MDKVLVVCSVFKPWTAGRQAQTNPLSYAALLIFDIKPFSDLHQNCH